MFLVDRHQLDLVCVLAQELLRHDLALPRLQHEPVAAPDAGLRRDDDDVAVAIDRLHAVAADLQRIGVLVADVGKIDLVPAAAGRIAGIVEERSEEHTSELQSLMRISYAVFCLKKKTRESHN